MIPIATALLQILIPVLVGKAESTFPTPGQGAIKHAWVTEMVADIFDGLEKRFNLPNWLSGIENELAVVAKELIEKAVSEIDPE